MLQECSKIIPTSSTCSITFFFTVFFFVIDSRNECAFACEHARWMGDGCV